MLGDTGVRLKTPQPAPSVAGLSPWGQEDIARRPQDEAPMATSILSTPLLSLWV